MDDTAGSLGRRVLAWIIIVAVAVIVLKLLIGAVFGILQALFAFAVLAAVVMGVLWALRHV